MKDRYLYRAKRTDNGELVEGYYAVIGEKAVIIEKRGEEFYDVEGEKKSHGNKIVEVDQSTICQCTGLKDKNGKLIWENDVVSVNDTLYVCRFDEENFEWEFKNHEETIGICCFHSSDIEITGNAIDNPELLEVGE